MDTKDKDLIRKMGQKAISDDDFNKQLQANVDFMKKYFSEKSRHGFAPQFVAVNMKHEVVIGLVADLPSDSEERHKMMYALGRKFKKENDFFPVCIFFLSEAWMRGQVEKGEKVQLPIRDNPSKTECIVVSGMTLDGRTNMATIPMARGAHDVVMLKEPTVTFYEGKQDVMSYILYEFYKGYFEEQKGEK